MTTAASDSTTTAKNYGKQTGKHLSRTKVNGNVSFGEIPTILVSCVLPVRPVCLISLRKDRKNEHSCFRSRSGDGRGSGRGPGSRGNNTSLPPFASSTLHFIILHFTLFCKYELLNTINDFIWNCYIYSHWSHTSETSAGKDFLVSTYLVNKTDSYSDLKIYSEDKFFLQLHSGGNIVCAFYVFL